MAVAAGVFDVKQERVAVDAHLGADDRFDSGLLCGLDELDHTVKVAGVCQGDRRQLVFGRQRDDVRRGQHGVEERINTANIERQRGQRGQCGGGKRGKARTGRAVAARGGRRVFRLGHRAFAQAQVVTAQDDVPAMSAAQVVECPRQAAALVVLPGRAGQRQFGAPPFVIDIAEAQGDQAQADPAFPGVPEHRRQPAVEVGFQIGRFRQCFAALVLVHVVVPDLDRERAHRLAVLAHPGHQVVRHAPQHGHDPFLVGHILRERLLLAVRFCRTGRRDHRPLVDPPRILSHRRRHPPEHQLQQIDRRGRHLPDARQPGRAQPPLGMRPDSRQPFRPQRMQKIRLPAPWHLHQRRRLPQLRRHRAHEFVAPDPLAHRNPQRLPDRPSDRLRHLRRRPAAPAQIEIPLVNARLLHVRREIVRIRKHPPRKLLVFVKIPRQHHQPRTQLPRPHCRHRRVHAKPPRLVRRRRDDPARFPAHRHRAPPQPRIRRLFDRREKRIGIQMHNRPPPLVHALTPRTSRTITPWITRSRAGIGRPSAGCAARKNACPFSTRYSRSTLSLFTSAATTSPGRGNRPFSSTTTSPGMMCLPTIDSSSTRTANVRAVALNPNASSPTGRHPPNRGPSSPFLANEFDNAGISENDFVLMNSNHKSISVNCFIICFFHSNFML